MNKSRFMLILIASLSLSFYSCGGGSKGGSTKSGGGTKSFTSRSGWKENDKKGWFFSGSKPKVKGSVGMTFVEGGTFTKGIVKDDVMHDWNNTPTRQQVRSFFIGETETTNYEYKEYLSWLQYTFPASDANFKEILRGALPDTLVWKNKLSKDDIYVNNYFRSPAFNYYPVVGVTWVQANRYCDWLTDRANEKALIDKGIMSKETYTNPEMVLGKNHFSTEAYKYDPKSMFEGQNVVDTAKIAKLGKVGNKNPRINARSTSFSNLVSKFRLPTETEWEYAALGQNAHREYNSFKGKPVFEENIKSLKGRNKGNYVANFKPGRGDYSGIAGGYGSDGSAITSDVKQHPSNDIGIYGMLGNVAEWTADVYRANIDEEASDFNYYRGNVYEKMVSNDKGGFEKIGEDQVLFDTLSNGRLAYKGLPGEYKKEVVEDDRNYRDGDFQSSLDNAGRGSDETTQKDSKMYNAPTAKFIVDEKGRVVMQKDTEKRTTDVSDESRVVKGGSWLDSAYWLDPAQRRYLNEKESTNWIGFRVAQDHLGDDTGGKARKSRGN